jgi:dihydroorotate dehydrogenase (fumarate)
MDLSTTYLGLKLAHPLVVGASPLVHDLDQVARLVDAGAAAIVMHSLFEEQLAQEVAAQSDFVDRYDDFNAEIRSVLPKLDDYFVGPDEYLEHLARVKKAAGAVPVLGSLNGTTNSGWLAYARRMEEAGADALELNVYALPTDAARSSSTIEQETVEMVRTVRAQVKLPIAVKLSPFYTAPVSFAAQLEAAGADGLVIFNRFYQPDIDIENLDVERTLELSTPAELRLRLRWTAVLSAKIRLSIAVSGGVHSATDAIKAIMAGASAVQAVSAILSEGPSWLSRTLAELVGWLEEHEYGSVGQALGSMNLARCPEPDGYERANYVRILRGWARAHLGY